MPYENIPHVGATYLDGAFKIITPSAQPEILVLGASAGGLPYERFRVGNVRQAEVEFGASSELMQGVHEAVAQNADNVSVMRIGGKTGSLVLTDSAGGTLTITPELRDAEALERYVLVMDGAGPSNRIAVFDIEDETWVYDSDEILVINGSVLPTVDVDDTGLDLFSVNSFTDPGTGIVLDTLVLGDFTAGGAATMTAPVASAGADGTSMSLPEYYATLGTAYHFLDFKDADMVMLKGTGVYIDAPNDTDGVNSADYWKGVPAQGDSNDVLGYVWQYIYQGHLHIFMTDSDDYFSVVQAAASLVSPGGHDLTITALKTGAGGNLVTLQIDTTGGLGPTVTISEPTAGAIAILVTDNGTSDTATTVAAIDAALGSYTLNSGVLASTLVDASGGSVQLLSVGGDLAATALAGGTGGAVLTHTDLTGDTVPAAVTAKFAAGADAELREVNFAHQLASFLHFASQTWSQMLGTISFSRPPGFSRSDVCSWIGQLPSYTQIGLDLAIDAPADNGIGVLGHKLLAGESKTSEGYRSALVEAGNSTDGFAFGGIIATTGSSLPNGDADVPADFAYGINDADELLDANGVPVDLGKHLFVTYDWPVHRNGFDGGSTYRGSIAGALLGKLATMTENEEPIGNNGVLLRVSNPPRVHSNQKNDLSRIRAIGTRFEEGLGHILVSARTAAHPDSDWTRASTIRSANRELTGIREIAKKFIGKPFSPERLASLQMEIDGYLQAERLLGFNQGAVALLSFTRSDRILGRLNIALRMVPPFSIELITVEVSLAADDSEL
jgi:hypothetical protein